MRLRIGWVGAAWVLGIVSAASLGATPSFQGLGDIPGGATGSAAFGISDDGSAVVGIGDVDVSAGLPPTEGQAFRWTQSGGMVGLGFLPGDASYSWGWDASGDGSVITGTARDSSGYQRAFRWTESGGMTDLGALPGYNDSNGQGVSADGSVIVGQGAFPWRWTQSEGMVSLGTLSGGILGGSAWAASANGSVIVGRGKHSTTSEAFRWTQATGMVGLGYLPGGGSNGESLGVSSDGSVVVGYGDSDSGDQAFIWTEADGMVGLGDLPGGLSGSVARGISADGSIVVGAGDILTAQLPLGTAFIWDEVNGMRDLHDVLTGLGLDLTDWSLLAAIDISADGQTIVGIGTNPSGDMDGWIAVVPEPTSLGLLALGGFALLRRRRG